MSFLNAACDDPFNILIDKYLHARSSNGIDHDRLPPYPTTKGEVEVILEHVLNIDGRNAGKLYSTYDEVARLQKRIAMYPTIDRNRFQDSRTRLSEMLAVFMPSLPYHSHWVKVLAETPVPTSHWAKALADSNHMSPPSSDESPALPDILTDTKPTTQSKPAVTRNQSHTMPIEPTSPSASSESDEPALALQVVKSIDPTPAEAFVKGEDLPSELRAKRVLSREASKPKPVKRQHSDSSR